MLCLVFIGLVGGYIALAYANSYWPFAQPLVPSTKTTLDKARQDVAGQKNKTNTPLTVEEPTELVGGNARLTITQLAQQDDRVTLHASLENVANGGRCIAYFNSDGGAIAKYAVVSSSGDTLSCSLEMSALEFSYLGKWSIRVVYSTLDNKKLEATGELVVR